MKVLKFGGTSVANSKSLNKVLKIIKNQNDSIVVVVSALGGVTNLLMEMLAMAESGQDNFKSNLSKIEKLHLEPIKKCIPIQNQSGIISYLKKHLNELESRIDAIFLLEEVTKKNNALVAAYGEILSSNIIQEIFKYNKIDSELKDARELIQTSTHNGREIVNENVTDQQIKNYFNNNNEITKNKIEYFLLFDPNNGSSVKACIENARNNLKMVRTAVTLEVWNAVNTWYHEVADYDKGKYDSKNLPQILDWIKRQVNLIKGTINNTQLLNDGFDFIYLGIFYERADFTARIIDVKYYILLPSGSYVGTQVDNFQWSIMLSLIHI